MSRAKFIQSGVVEEFGYSKDRLIKGVDCVRLAKVHSYSGNNPTDKLVHSNQESYSAHS